MFQRGTSGYGCDLVLIVCKYDFRKGVVFVLSWARVRRLGWGSISSELLMCGGGVFYVYYSDCVTVCRNVCCVAGVVENSVL